MQAARKRTDSCHLLETTGTSAAQSLDDSGKSEQRTWWGATIGDHHRGSTSHIGPVLCITDHRLFCVDLKQLAGLSFSRLTENEDAAILLFDKSFKSVIPNQWVMTPAKGHS